MAGAVRATAGIWSGRLGGQDAANAFLDHLRARAFSSATVRAYAFDVANLGRFLVEQGLGWPRSMRRWMFDWVEWQGVRRAGPARRWSGSRPPSAAPSTVNRRVAAVRAFFEYLVMAGVRTDNPVPAPRRGQGLRPLAARAARSSGPGACPGRGPAGPRAASAAGIVVRPRCRGVPGYTGNASGSGDGAGDAARWAALSRGPWAAARRRRPWAGAGCG